MSDHIFTLAAKFEALLKKAEIFDEINDLVSRMKNEGYVDSEILNMIEDALVQQRKHTRDMSVWHTPTIIEPSDQSLTEYADKIANAYKLEEES